jgi:hypothetical protein
MVCLSAVYILLSWERICRCRRLNIIEWQAPHRSGSWHTSRACCMYSSVQKEWVSLNCMCWRTICALIVTQRTLCTLWPTQSHCSGFAKCRIVSIDYARQWDHTHVYPRKWLTDGDVVTRLLSRQALLPYANFHCKHGPHVGQVIGGLAISSHAGF